MSDLSLGSEFKTYSRENWLKIVEDALKGASFEDALVRHTDDGIALSPIYARGDSEAHMSGGVPGEKPFTRGMRVAGEHAAWSIAQIYDQHDPEPANDAILDDLAGGVNDITLRLNVPGQSGLEPRYDAIAAALEGVQLEMVDVSLEAGDQYLGGAQSLFALWSAQGVADGLRRGAVNADPLGTLARTGGLEESLDDSLDTLAQFTRANLASAPQLRLLLADGRPYHEAGASEGQELAAVLATMVAYLRRLENAQAEPHTVLPHVAITIAADTDLFVSMAKVRAARRLVWQIAEACGAGDAARSVRLGVQTSERMMSARDVHVNMLRTTLACTGAALGGSDVITVLPFSWPLGRPDDFARRMARNTHAILMEEAALARVQDTAGGSWYVEYLTDALAESAWSLFQEIETRGGMEDALTSGWYAEAIARTAEARLARIATGDEAMTGLSSYPNLDEVRPDVTPRPMPVPLGETGVRITPLERRRNGAPFEALRDAADAYASETGHPPTVFLATLGRRAAFTPRASYARNLFATGGVRALESGEQPDAAGFAEAFRDSGAGIACVCGSDDAYSEGADKVARALKDAGASRVYLAGRPGDRADAWREAGVDAYIHVGCDNLEALREAQTAIGVKGVTAT